MKKRTRTCRPNRKKIKNWLIATGFEPLSPIWDCSFGYSVPHIVQQIKTVCHAASTQNGYDIFDVYWFSHSGKTKESSFAIFQENKTFRQKFL